MTTNQNNEFVDASDSGVRRMIQTSNAPQDIEIPHEPIRHNPSARHTSANGEITDLGSTGFNTAEFIGGETEGVIATAVTPWGAPALEHNAKTLATVGGVQTTLENAQQMGYVTKNAMGQYVDTAQGEASAPLDDQQSQDNSELDYDPIDNHEEANITELESAIGSTSLLAAAAEYAKTGVMDEATIAKYVATDGGHSTEQVHQAAQQMVTALEGQVMSYFTESGLPEDLHEHFGEWVQNNKETEYQQAFMNFLTTRQLSSWNGLLEGYAAHSRKMMNQYKQGR